MSRRNRLILVSIVVVVLTIELGLRISTSPQAVVEVINHGSAELLNLRVRVDGNETVVDRIEPGASRSVKVGARSRTRIRFTFNQAGSALSLVQFDDFDPSQLRSDHEKYVVELTDSGYRAVREDLGPSEDQLVDGLGGAFLRLWNGTP